uniref:Mediator of RNA polymerase II transcription subunit 13 n=1 Tax=Mesocestoides corti TaxID=53468 RepID=A0A5K3G7Z0_MESCO
VWLVSGQSWPEEEEKWANLFAHSLGKHWRKWPCVGTVTHLPSTLTLSHSCAKLGEMAAEAREAAASSAAKRQVS